MWFNLVYNLKKSRNKGIILFPFLLVLMIVLFLTFAFFSIAFSFVHISLSQYMAYSSSRKLALSGESALAQENNAKKHYQKLRNQFFKKNQYVNQNSWFSIDSTLSNVGFVLRSSGIKDQNPYRDMFYGSGINFTSRIMSTSIPFLMKSEKTKGYKTRITSFLGREPSTAECKLFFEERSVELCKKFPLVTKCDKAKIEKIQGSNGC